MTKTERERREIAEDLILSNLAHKSTVIDLGSLCVYCRKDTAFGHPDQVFVNRIPADTCEGVGKPTYKGYMCGDCLAEADQEFDEEQENNHD